MSGTGYIHRSNFMLESALAAMAILAAGAQPAKLPNLVMILQDDLGYYGASS